MSVGVENRTDNLHRMYSISCHGNPDHDATETDI